MTLLKYVRLFTVHVSNVNVISIIDSNMNILKIKLVTVSINFKLVFLIPIQHVRYKVLNVSYCKVILNTAHTFKRVNNKL